MRATCNNLRISQRSGCLAVLVPIGSKDYQFQTVLVRIRSSQRINTGGASRNNGVWSPTTVTFSTPLFNLVKNALLVCAIATSDNCEKNSFTDFTALVAATHLLLWRPHCVPKTAL